MFQLVGFFYLILFELIILYIGYRLPNQNNTYEKIVIFTLMALLSLNAYSQKKKPVAKKPATVASGLAKVDNLVAEVKKETSNSPSTKTVKKKTLSSLKLPMRNLRQPIAS